MKIPLTEALINLYEDSLYVFDKPKINPRSLVKALNEKRLTPKAFRSELLDLSNQFKTSYLEAFNEYNFQLIQYKLGRVDINTVKLCRNQYEYMARNRQLVEAILMEGLRHTPLSTHWGGQSEE